MRQTPLDPGRCSPDAGVPPKSPDAAGAPAAGCPPKSPPPPVAGAAAGVAAAGAPKSPPAAGAGVEAAAPPPNSPPPGAGVAPPNICAVDALFAAPTTMSDYSDEEVCIFIQIKQWPDILLLSWR